MIINSELLADLEKCLHNENPEKGSMRFEQGGSCLMFKIVDEKNIFVSAAFNSLMCVDFKVKGIEHKDDIVRLVSESGTELTVNYSDKVDCSTYRNCWVNDREVELIQATLDNQREDNLMAKDGSGLVAPYHSLNGGWKLEYDGKDRRICYPGNTMVFHYDSIRLSKTYIMLYNQKYLDDRIYLSRSSRSPF